MRVVRFAALLLGLMLLSVSVSQLLGARSRASDDLDHRANTAKLVAAAEIGAVIDHGTSAALITSSIPTGAMAGVPLTADGQHPLSVAIEDALSDIPGATGCWESPDATCDSDPLYDAAVRADGVARAIDGTARVVHSDGQILIVGRSVSRSVSVIAVPFSALVERATAAVDAAVADAEVSIELRSASDVVVERTESLSGGRTSGATDLEGIDSGSIRVFGFADGSVPLAGGEGGSVAALGGAGVALLLLAGWAGRRERRKLERRATTDDLTGLANRRELERLGNEALIQGERMGASVCVMLIDLNGFKQINDTLGHSVGDLVLEHVATRLAAAVRDTDTVGRWGGDEFVALLPGLDDGTTVRVIADRISVSLAEPIITEEGHELSIGGAIGAAVYPRHGSNFQHVLGAADEAMYAAKSTGVTYRLADTIPEDADVLTSAYVGPDRRRSPADA